MVDFRTEVVGSIDGRALLSFKASLTLRQNWLILMSLDWAWPMVVKWSISSWLSPILRSFRAHTN